MLFALLLVTTVVAAARGLWSPCGLSMLSSLNPVSERARGHRFWVTALWYVTGAVAGGAVLGATCALGAFGAAALHLPTAGTWTLVGVFALVALASDLRLGGWQLPVHPRQVDERWLSTYRRWIYAGGYGAQIGTGFATYVMTAGTYLLVALAVLTGRPGQALAAGVVFGLARGLGIALAGLAQDSERLRVLMARVDAAAAPSVVGACVAHTGVTAAAVGALAGPVAAAGVGGAALALGIGLLALSSRRTVPSA